jgi:type I restriction enzyme S subunit
MIDHMTEECTPQWKVLRLCDVANFQNGHAFYADGYSSEGFLALDLFNVDEEGKLRFGERDKFVSPELAKKYVRFVLNKNDLVIVMTDMTQRLGILGKCCIVDASNRYILNQRMGRITATTHILPKYLRYYINSPAFRIPLHSLAKGAVQKYVNTDDIKESQVLVPPISTQERIVCILSAYDDLIENNIRRIKVLEEMAKMIYREWFVNFRFPGNENVKMVESEDGLVPHGWSAKRLGDVLQLEYGKALKSADREGGDVPVFGSSGVVGFHSESLADGPGVIVGRKGNVGSVFFCPSKFWVIDTAYFVRTSLSPYFIFFNLLTQNFLNNDAAVPGLNRNQAHSLRIIVPDVPTMERFDQLVVPMFRQQTLLRERNAILREIRDLLLPKLISGELSVNQSETEAVVQGV